MLFTRLGRIVAILALILGIWHIVGGLLIATGAVAPEADALARFFGNKTTGQVIDRGFYAVLFAIALGILTEISSSTSRI
jgi:hypothetical protein